MCHLYCLERLAEVRQCTIPDLRCPFCLAQFSLFCRPQFQLSPAGNEVFEEGGREVEFDEAAVDEDDSPGYTTSSTPRSSSSDRTFFDYEDAAPRSSSSDRTLFDLSLIHI